MWLQTAIITTQQDFTARESANEQTQTYIDDSDKKETVTTEVENRMR